MFFRAICVSVLSILAVGCSEYDVRGQLDIWGEPHPREVPSTDNSDRLVQLPVPMVDVLFVVDNSSSMGPEQASLAQAFPAFLNFFLGSGLDYHVGVVATDMDDPSFSGKLSSGNGLLWIDDQTKSPEAVFAEMTNLGTIIGSVESGRAAAYTALELRADEYNAGFSRQEADLHIVAISDDEDQSGNQPIGLEEFIGWLLDSARPSDREVTFNSIVNDQGPCDGDCAPGLQYMAVSDAVGGIIWDITQDDWDQVLEQLGMQAAGLQREFFLSELPVPESIRVEVVSDELTFELHQDVDWEYNPLRNSVVFFEFVPAPLSEVLVHYTVLAAEG